MKKKLSVILTIMVTLVLATTASAQVSYPDSAYTSYQVVNLSDSESANITVNYYDENGTAASYVSTHSDVPPGGSVTVQQALEGDLANGRYSAVVSSDMPVAAIVNQQLGQDGSGTSIAPFSSYSGSSAGTTEVTLPAVMHNWFGYYTEIYIQNVGTAAATNVQITYNPTSIGSCVTGATGVQESAATAADSLALYATEMKSQFSLTSLGAPAASAEECAMYDGRFLGAATITADQPVVVIVNEYVQDKLFTYNGFTANDTSTELIAPAYMRNYYGYYASLTLANPDMSQDAIVELSYTSDAEFSSPTSTTVTGTHVIPAGKSITLYEGPTSTSDQTDLETVFPIDESHSFFGSVIIKSTNGIPVQAMVNQEAIANQGNQAGSYNGMGATAGSQKVSVPLVQSDFYGYYTSITIMTVDGQDADIRITYTSDGQYSSVQNHSESYDMRTSDGFLNRYEGSVATTTQSDILDDATWQDTNGVHQFIGSAVIEVLNGGPDIVVFVNSESSTAPSADVRDSMYTYNAFNLE